MVPSRRWGNSGHLNHEAGMARRLPSGGKILDGFHMGRKHKRKADPRPLDHPLWERFRDAWIAAGLRLDVLDDPQAYVNHEVYRFFTLFTYDR